MVWPSAGGGVSCVHHPGEGEEAHQDQQCKVTPRRGRLELPGVRPSDWPGGTGVRPSHWPGSIEDVAGSLRCGGVSSSLHCSTGREDRAETSAGNWLVCGKQPGSMLSMELTKGAEPVEWLPSVQFDIWLCSRHTVDGSLPLGGVPGRQLVWPLIG